MTARRARRSLLGLLLGLLAIGAAVALVGPVEADTPTAHIARASTASQSDVAPPGPLTGLTDGTVVTVRVDEDPTPGSTNKLSSIALRLCSGGANITNDGEFVPDGGFCTDAPLSPGTDYSTPPKAKVTGTDTFISQTFRVGIGTRTFPNSATGDPITVTCDVDHPCGLWVRISRTSGIDFVHFDLQLAGAPVSTTTTTTSTTTTSTSSTTTTSVPGTTSTTIPGTTTSTTVPATTSTTVVGSTTSSSSTTTSTLAGGSTSSTVGAVVAGEQLGGGGPQAAGAPLPRTGADPLRLLWLASSISGAGAMFVIAGERRRRRPSSR